MQMARFLDRERLTKIIPNLSALKNLGGGPELASLAIRYAAQAEEAGALQGPEYAAARVELDRWRHSPEEPHAEQIGEMRETDWSVIRWQRFLQAVFLDLSDRREDEPPPDGRFPRTRKPKCTLHVRHQWWQGVQRLAALLKSEIAVPVVEGDAKPQAAGKGVAPRNTWFLQQWEARGDTWHKPSKVLARWNAMKLSDREAICPDWPKTVSRDVVSRGITRARHARDGKPSKSPTKRKRATRKA